MSKKILIVDDEEDIRNTLKRLLNACYEYEIETSNDGFDAFNKIVDADEKDKQFDLIITDIAMPKLDGAELLGKLKETFHIPIIVITGYPDRKSMLGLMDNGCDAYLVKPIEHDKLLDCINKIFSTQNDIDTPPES